MKAIILAAGRAKRLRPITNNLPKCLLKFNGSAIIDYQVSALRKNKIKEIIVVVGFQKQKIIQHLKKNYPDVSFKFVENKKYKETNPAYSLWLARKYLTNSTIYLNADVLCNPEIIKKIIKDKKPSVTAIQRVPWDEEEVNVIINKDSQIIEMGKHIAKNLSYGEFIGVTKMGKKFIKNLIKVLDSFIGKKEYKKFAADAINLTIQRGEKMYALDVTNLQAIEIDTIEDLKRAKKLWKNYDHNQKIN